MIIQGRLLIDPHEPPAPGWVAVDSQRIADIGHGPCPQKPDFGDDHAIICPGFIDAHIHLPQIDAVGCDGMELLQWLDRVVYPAEMTWSDIAAARRDVRRAYRRMIRAGTLGYAGYLTSHAHDAIELIRGANVPALRAAVGQVLMDRRAPAPLIDNQPFAPASPDARITPTVNPRFAVSCSETLLRTAGEQANAADAGRMVQTHLAEAPDEQQLVHELFPSDADYTAVYDRFGLLSDRTLLAHCLHLSGREWSLLAERRSVVVHCPGANAFLRSGVFDLDAARDHGVRLALGSDVAAGPDVAMPRVARAMIDTAKIASMTRGRQTVPSPAEAWQLITRGNADAIGWSQSGRLEIGADADLLVLKPDVPVDEHLIGRLIYTWRDDYIEDRVVAGRRVDSKHTEGTPEPNTAAGGV